MDDRYLATLEFFEILERLAGYASFSASADLVRRLRPTNDPYHVRRRIAETTEAKALLEEKSDLTIGGAHDVRARWRNMLRCRRRSSRWTSSTYARR